MSDRQPTALHLFCGVGGAALGYQRAGFTSVGAFDIDALACKAFDYLTGEKATQADLFAMSPADLRNACTGRPDVVFTSPPCKPHSRCLPQAKSEEPEYVAMAAVALHSIWLVLEAWETPPPLILLENVPGMLSRGKDWMRHIKALLRSYGYAIKDDPHDCGQLGGLAQRRKRVLLAARHMEQVKAHLRLPPLQRLRGVGEVLGQLPVPLPGSKEGGRMHRLPRMSAMNWVRLALIPAGGDWRDLPPAVAINGGPDRHHGGYGVNDWDEPSKTVVGAAEPRNKPVSIADPRLGDRAGRQNGGFGVNEWPEPSHAVLAEGTVRNTWASVEDPRVNASPDRHTSGLGINEWKEPARTVVAKGRVRSARYSVQDPRLSDKARHNSQYGLGDWGEPAQTITASARFGGGWSAIADPRLASTPRSDSYGVGGWDDPAHTVLASESHDNSRASVADPRIEKQRREGAVGVTGWEEPSTTVIGRAMVQNGPWQVADPRLGHQPRSGIFHVQAGDEPSNTVIASAGSKTAGGTFGLADPRIDYTPRPGTYGVVGWAEPSHVVRANFAPNRAPSSVADPRMPEIVGPSIDTQNKRPCYLIIQAADGTWHRPMTTLELAALQGLPMMVDGKWLDLPGNHEQMRELIGNAVPVPAAEAIARACAAALREAGVFTLSNDEIWVAPPVEALSV